MSMQNPTDIELAMVKFICGHCWVAQGQWCITRDKKPAATLHSDRWWQAREVAELMRTYYAAGPLPVSGCIHGITMSKGAAMTVTNGSDAYTSWTGP